MKNQLREQQKRVLLSKTIVYDNGGKTLDRYTVFTPDGWIYGMCYTASGFNLCLGCFDEVEKGPHLGRLIKNTNRLNQDLKSAIINRLTCEYDCSLGYTHEDIEWFKLIKLATA